MHRASVLNSPLSNQNWLLVTKQEIDAYRMSADWIHLNGQPTAMASPFTSVTATAAEKFSKGVKRDPGAFKPLKDNRYFETWYVTFEATAFAQEVDEVLDPLYVAHTAEDRAVFDKKKMYMYSVYTTTLLTDRGKELP